jgi:hypothetical protein
LGKHNLVVHYNDFDLSVSSTSTSAPVSSWTSSTVVSTSHSSTITSAPASTSLTYSATSSVSSVPDSTSTPTPSSLPDGWSLTYACAEDNASRILSRVAGYTLANNTPANCASICASGNYGWAGVEYGDEV